MITIYLNVNGDKVKVIQKDKTPASGEIYRVSDVKNVLQAKYYYAIYLQAQNMGEEIDSMLDNDPETYTRLKIAMRKVSRIYVQSR